MNALVCEFAVSTMDFINTLSLYLSNKTEVGMILRSYIWINVCVCFIYIADRGYDLYGNFFLYIMERWHGLKSCK